MAGKARALAGGEAAAEEVARYLRRHPDFLAARPELLEAMAPPRRRLGSNVEDWQAHLIERLRHEAGRLARQRSDLVERARRDRSLQDRVHRAALAVISAPSLDRLVEIATLDMAALLAVDVVALAVETDRADGRARLRCGVRCVPPGALAPLTPRAVVLRAPAGGEEAIFGGAGALVASEALARFGGRGGLPRGVLALGSRDAARFRPGDPTGLYRFLAEALEHALAARLGLSC